MPNGLPISLDHFKKLPNEDQNAAIYEFLVHMDQSGFECEKDREYRIQSCETRFKTLEGQQLVNKGWAAGSGFVGGFIAAIAKMFGTGS